MNSKIQEQTGKTFSVHPALIYSIITKQASGLHKALLELAMNSVDAGATLSVGTGTYGRTVGICGLSTRSRGSRLGIRYRRGMIEWPLYP